MVDLNKKNSRNIFSFSNYLILMRSFLWKTIKFVLRTCLFVLLGWFLFGFFKFKWNFVEYVSYLNGISLQELFTENSSVEDDSLLERTDEELIKEVLEDSSSLEDDYFLPEIDTSTWEVSFGFSWSLEEKNPIEPSETSSSSSKEDLINLIKSREQ